MKKALHVVVLLCLFSCNGGENVEKDKKSIERFKSFVFSIEPGWSTDDSRDVEIFQDGTTYLRLRDDREVKENYKVKLDSQSLRQVFILVDSMNIEALDSVYQDYFDGTSYSLRLRNEKGEVRAKGMDFPNEVQRMLKRVVEIVEGQQLSKSTNRHFSTTEDVLLSPPPVPVNVKLPLDSI